MTEMTDSKAMPARSRLQLAPAPSQQQAQVAAVLVLNGATGVVEAVCFAHLGAVFAAFVTGTVVLAGVHLARGGLTGLLPYGISFLGFVVGSALGGILTSGAAPPDAAVRRALGGELLALAIAAVCSLFPTDGGKTVALGVLAVGMAIQFSATKRLKVADVGFAALTGLIHGTVSDLAQRNFIRLPRRLIAIGAILGGAIAGTAISHFSVPAAILCALMVVIIGALLVRMGTSLAS